VSSGATAPLAIVLPVWRARFFEATLASIAAQRCRDFVVVVGDDASPDDIGALCQRWAPQLPALRYTRFADNLGGHDLVAQWQRCVALAPEPWIWLFSDDDLMPPDAVERLLAAVRAPGAQPRLYHFNVERIDAAGQVLAAEPAFPGHLSAREFMRRRLGFALSSYAPDYVFQRAALERIGGFVPFPRAWCADDATWMALAAEHGIQTLAGAPVRWRDSGDNISSRHDRDAPAKFEALLGFLRWLDGELQRHPARPGEPGDEALQRLMPRWFFRQVRFLGLGFGEGRAQAAVAALGGLRGFSRPALWARIVHAELRRRRRR
jgi:glycosyltransferase involved in cell wall biosynthesis